MRKIITLLIAVVLCFVVVGCGDSEKEPTTEKKEPLTSEQIVQMLKTDYSLPVTQELSYTSETDPNDLLGRPGEYTSKTNFNDERDTENVESTVGESEEGDYRDCTIEVFDNANDAKARKKYLEETWEIGGLLGQSQYMYYSDYALMRITFELTPEQAAEYEAAFNEIMEK